MRPNRIRAYCRRCRHDQWFVREEMNHALHLFLVVCTCGLWSVSWLSAAIGSYFRPWRCKHCSWPRPDKSETPVVD